MAFATWNTSFIHTFKLTRSSTKFSTRKMRSFSISCSMCSAKYKARSSLWRHYRKKHRGFSKRNVDLLPIIDNNGYRFVEPVYNRIRKGTVLYQYYLFWLASVAERVNGLHNPRFPGEYSLKYHLHNLENILTSTLLLINRKLGPDRSDASSS